MHRQPEITEKRLRRLRRQIIKPNIWGPAIGFDVEMWQVPPTADGLAGDPVPVEQAIAGDFSPVSVGTPWGAPWATTWFKLRAAVPPQFAGLELQAAIDIGFSGIGPGFQAEGMIWQLDDNGGWVPQRGLHPMNHTVRVAESAVEGAVIEILVEAASNPTLIDYVPNPNSDLLTAGRDPIYRLGNVRLAVFNADLYELDQDLRCVAGWVSELPMDQPRANDLWAALEDAMDALDPVDPASSAARARAELAGVLATPAVSSAHHISAIGHAHIDSAWLWPIRETIRKCARTFSNVLQLMEVDPEFRFGCSQAVQYEWMREHYPSIFERIRAAVERGQWIPIGGQWVEADGNITGGESHVRQLLHGQRFFREHFGLTCTEVWIPDVFGYPATLPQIFRLGGAERFLTQKLSWNRTNKFPHHTFWWEGIDGSRVYTHFPPVDTYNANFSPRELAYAVRNFRDHGASGRSLMPFGHGDGGGGPSPDMLDQFHRSRDFEGSPRITMDSPAEFFDAVMAEHPDPPVWVGELYFEMHRGTYTSQARTKIGNRRAEVLLRETELWSVAAFGGSEAGGYPAAELDELWKTVLLHQFHDILPGTSIGWVHREAEATYAQVIKRLEVLIDGAVVAISESVHLAGAAVLANAAPFDRDEVVIIGPADISDTTADRPGWCQHLSDGSVAQHVAIKAMTVAPLVAVAPGVPVQASGPDHNGEFFLDNGVLSVRIGSNGQVLSLTHTGSGRELLAPGATGSEWHLHHDMPFEYDAWDIEEYYRNRVEVLDGVESVELIDSGPLVARIRVQRRFNSSKLVETFELRSGSPRLDIHVELDWHERDHLLKVAWPVDLSTTEVTRDIQYGHISTPIHRNTSWDTARFEISAHKWIDLNEGDFGVAMLNDGRYGHDVTRTRGPSGEPTTTMRLTVAKGAQYPDPHADEGMHTFTYSVMPHSGDSQQQVIAEGYRLNMPIRVTRVATAGSPDATSTVPSPNAAPAGASALARSAAPVVRATDPSVIVEVVKAAEDGSGDLIIRVWESLGNRVASELIFSHPVSRARLTDALEDGPPATPAPSIDVVDPRHLRISLRPFQIATIRVVF